MPAIPIPQTQWDMGWLIYRTIMQFVFVFGVFLMIRIIGQYVKSMKESNKTSNAMLNQIQADRLERDTLLAGLKKTADELEEKVASQLKESTEAARACHSEIIRAADNLTQASRANIEAKLDRVVDNTAATAQNTAHKE
jgi:uncharacterized protein YoxC